MDSNQKDPKKTQKRQSKPVGVVYQTMAPYNRREQKNIWNRFFTATSSSSSSSRRPDPRRRRHLKTLLEVEAELLEWEKAQFKAMYDVLEARVLELEAILGKDTTSRTSKKSSRPKIPPPSPEPDDYASTDMDTPGMKRNRALWASMGESVGSVLREPGAKKAKKEPGSSGGVGGGAMDVEDSEEEEMPTKESKPGKKYSSSSSSKKDVGSVKKEPPAIRSSSSGSSVVRRVGGWARYRCEVCDRRFKSAPGLWYHKRVAHEGKRWSCDRCTKSFAQSQTLREHVLVEHYGKVYPCALCSRYYTTRSGLSTHVKKEHQMGMTEARRVASSRGLSWDPIDRPDDVEEEDMDEAMGYVCGVCDRRFKGASGLRRHKRVAHEGKRWSCDRCTKSFAHSQNLRDHVLVEHHGKVYPCALCSRYYTNRTTLGTHVKKEHQMGMTEARRVASSRGLSWDPIDRPDDGEKEDVEMVDGYVCGVCDRRFKGASGLWRHKRVAHEGKRWSCDRCTKSFAESRTLRDHLLVDHDGKVYPCAFCDRYFNNLSNLSQHVKKEHEMKLPEARQVAQDRGLSFDPIDNPSKN